MKTTNLLTTMLIASVVLFAGCSNNDPEPATRNPVVIPVQTTGHATISLAGSSELAYLQALPSRAQAQRISPATSA